jgi:hypothetical protein
MHTINSQFRVEPVFGVGFVAEHHADENRPNLLAKHPEGRELHFTVLLEALRSALHLGR